MTDDDPVFTDDPMNVEVERDPMGTIDRITVDVATHYVAAEDREDHPSEEDPEIVDLRAEFVVENEIAKWDRFGEIEDAISSHGTPYARGIDPQAFRAATPVQAVVKHAVPGVEHVQPLDEILSEYYDQGHRLFNREVDV